MQPGPYMLAIYLLYSAPKAQGPGSRDQSPGALIRETSQKPCSSILALFTSQNSKCKIFINHLHGILNVVKK